MKKPLYPYHLVVATLVLSLHTGKEDEDCFKEPICYLELLSVKFKTLKHRILKQGMHLLADLLKKKVHFEKLNPQLEAWLRVDTALILAYL